MIISKLIDLGDTFFDYLSAMNRSNLTDYCDLEAPNNAGDANTYPSFVSKHGSLLSVIKVAGRHKDATTNDFLYDVVSKLNEYLSESLKRKGYAIQIYYSVDPTNTDLIIEKALAPCRLTTERLSLDFKTLYDSRVKTLKNVINDEHIYIGIWTDLSVLTVQERQSEEKAASLVEKKVFGITQDSLNVFKGYKILESKHAKFVSNVRSALNASRIMNRVLDLNEASFEMKRSVMQEVPEGWKPILPGEVIMPAVRRNMPEKRVYDAMLPKFGWQLMNTNAMELTDKIQRIGDYLYSPCYVDVLPAIDDALSFNDLCNNLNSHRMPWRMSILIEGEGLSGFAFKKAMSQILTLGNGTNRLVTNAIDYLEKLQEQKVDLVPMVRMSFATWTKAQYKVGKDKEQEIDFKVIEQQRGHLENALSTWGKMEIVSSTGDPLDSTLSSALGVKRGSVATKTVAPLNRITQIFPFNRTVSPWETGGVLFRTADGKLFPNRSFSDIQDTPLGLIWSPPGSGKSVLLNYLNTGLCMEQDNISLPWVRLLDIGKSGMGFAQMVQQSLPKEKRHLVTSSRLRNIRENSINIFDTKEGCREPLPAELSFQKIFLRTLIAEDSGELSKGMEGMIDILVPEMYHFFSDKSRPKKYTAGFSRRVDIALRDIRYEIDENTTWWNVVDALFKAKRLVEVNEAQRYAVPMLSDITMVLTQSSYLKEYYSITKDAGSEQLLEEFKRKINEVLKKYPILSDVTNIGFANAKIVVLDLDEVTKGSLKDKTVFYMIGSYMLSKDFFIDKAEAESTPCNDESWLSKSCPVDMYKEFHRRRFSQMREEKKRLSLDEFHVASDSPYMVELIEDYFRLGRKYNVEIILASQLYKDFTPTMIELSTYMYIMKGTEREVIKDLSPKIGLSPTEEIILEGHLQNRLFLGRYKMGKQYAAKGGKETSWASFRLTAPLSPEELWAYKTDAVDAGVRDLMYEKIGLKKTLFVLSSLCPSGVSGRLDETGDFESLTEEERAGVSQRLVKEILTEAVSIGLLQN